MICLSCQVESDAFGSCLYMLIRSGNTSCKLAFIVWIKLMGMCRLSMCRIDLVLGLNLEESRHENVIRKSKSSAQRRRLALFLFAPHFDRYRLRFEYR